MRHFWRKFHAWRRAQQTRSTHLIQLRNVSLLRTEPPSSSALGESEVTTKGLQTHIRHACGVWGWGRTASIRLLALNLPYHCRCSKMTPSSEDKRCERAVSPAAPEGMAAISK